MSIRIVVPLDPAHRADFDALMRASGDEPSACRCTAYHGCDVSLAGAGAECRARMFDDRVVDGALLYVDDVVAGWCQSGPRRSFAVFGKSGPEAPALATDVWTITCMVIAPAFRGRGLCHELFASVLDAIRARPDATSVLVTGHRLGPHYSSPLPELPESVCIRAGMTMIRDDAECPLYELRW
ncbi:MAG: GNAT family N-acetyltransferase [Planctomycetota bacterium]